MQLETYFELTEQPRHLETALFLESMRKGNKQAKEFYQEMVDSDQIRERYSILMQKAEEFFAKTTTTYEYVQKLNRMRQLHMESLEDWYSRVLKIQQEAVNAKKGDSINTIKSFAIDTFINGLSDDDLRWEVRKEVKDPSERTLRDLLKVANRTSEALQHHKSLSRSKEEEIRANFAYDRKGYQNKNQRKNTNKQAGNPITSYNYSSTPSPNSSGPQNSGPNQRPPVCAPKQRPKSTAACLGPKTAAQISGRLFGPPVLASKRWPKLVTAVLGPKLTDQMKTSFGSIWAQVGQFYF